MKKALIMALCLVLVAALSVAGTLAYLQFQTPTDVNVMTIGNVKIEQLEYERAVDENGNYITVDTSDVNPNYGFNTTWKLQPFTQGKPAIPAVYSNGTGEYSFDEQNHQLYNEVGAPGSNALFSEVGNVIDKFVFVKNTGKTSAYYRTIIAIEWPYQPEWESIVPEKQLVHKSLNGNSRFTSNDIGFTYIDGTRYKLREMVYNQELAPGEVSRPSLLQLFLDPKVTNEICAAFGETWDIFVVSQAVQASGFDDADTALDAAFGDITLTQHPWSETAPVIPTVVDSADELAEALEKGGEIILSGDVQGNFVIPADKEVTLNLNGKNITYAGTPTGGNPPMALINNGKLVIEGNGTISADYAAFYNTGSVQINGGTFESASGFGMITDNIYGTETATTVINGGIFQGIGVYNPTHLTINNAVINVGRDPDGASDFFSDKMALFVSPTFSGVEQTATVILNGGNINGDVYVYSDGFTDTTFENNGAIITGSILTND